MNIVELLLASSKRLPNQIAFVTEDQKITYRELVSNVFEVAGKFQKLGIGKESNVVLMVGNRIDYVYSYLALLALGTTVVPINPLFKERELTYVLNDSEAEAIIFDRLSSETVLACKPESRTLKHFVAIDAINETGITRFDILEKQTEDPALVQRDFDSVAQIIYTSGTTGNPKGAMISHYNLYWMSITTSTLNDIKADDRVLCVLPLFHAYAKIQCLLSPLIQGATVYLKERFSVDQVLKTIHQDKITVFFGVPTMFSMIIQSKDLNEYSYDSLRLCVSGGASISTEHIEKIKELLDIDIVEGYGQTESTVGIAYNPLKGIKKVGSVGLPIAGVLVQIVDDVGKELNRGEIGEIIFSGPNAMKGYYKNEEETKKTIKNGWVYTGDLGYLDGDGYLFIVDRKKDLIIKGGYNVYPREIEELLYTHPNVAECAVIGRPDEIFGETIEVYVVTNQETAEQELKEFCSMQLVHYKVPQKFHFLEELPKTASGKIMKRKLAETFKIV
jgi:long-chain acyl-CoA synthetase